MVTNIPSKKNIFEIFPVVLSIFRAPKNTYLFENSEASKKRLTNGPFSSNSPILNSATLNSV